MYIVQFGKGSGSLNLINLGRKRGTAYGDLDGGIWSSRCIMSFMFLTRTVGGLVVEI